MRFRGDSLNTYTVKVVPRSAEVDAELRNGSGTVWEWEFGGS